MSMFEDKICESRGCLNNAVTKYDGYFLCYKCYCEHKALGEISIKHKR